MNPIGIGLILFIVYYGYRGFQRGLIEEVGRLAGLVLALILAHRLTVPVASLFDMQNQLLRSSLAFAAVFLVTLIGVHFLTQTLKNLVGLIFLSWLDHIGGIVFGVLKSILIIGVAIYLLESFDVSRGFLNRLKDESFLYRQIVVVKDGLFDLLGLDGMIEDVHLRMKNLQPEDLIRPLLEEL